MPNCPHCTRILTSDQVFDLLNESIAESTAVCPHAESKRDPLRPGYHICAKCGMTIDHGVPL